MFPNAEEKELFPVIVHQQHFAVPARRLYRLLSPAKVPFQTWFNDVCTYCLLQEGVDYFARDKDYVFRLYTVKKICPVMFDNMDHPQMLRVFNFARLKHEQLLQVSVSFMGEYLGYWLTWHERQGYRWYRWADMLQHSAPQPLNKNQYQQQYPHLFTTVQGTPYIRQELATLLLLEKWLHDHKAFLLQTQPLQPVLH